MTTQIPAHLARFNNQRSHRIGNPQAAIQVATAAGQAEHDRIIARAALQRDRMILDGKMESRDMIREAEIEARKIQREANDIMSRAERRKQTAARKVEAATARAAEIRQEAYEQKREIILAAKNCTEDVQEMYQVALEDTKRIRTESRRKTHAECQAMRVEAEQHINLIREKARTEGLAMADLEIRDRANRELISSQAKAVRRG